MANDAPHAARIFVQSAPGVFTPPGGPEADALTLNDLRNLSTASKSLVVCTDGADAESPDFRALRAQSNLIVAAPDVLARVYGRANVTDATALSALLAEVQKTPYDRAVLIERVKAELACAALRALPVPTLVDGVEIQIKAAGARLLSAIVQLPDGVAPCETSEALLRDAVDPSADVGSLTRRVLGTSRVGSGVARPELMLEVGAFHERPACMALLLGLADRQASGQEFARRMRSCAAASQLNGLLTTDAIRALMLEFLDHDLFHKPLCDAVVPNSCRPGFTWIGMSIVDLPPCALRMLTRMPSIGGVNGSESARSLTSYAAVMRWYRTEHPPLGDGLLASLAKALCREPTDEYVKGLATFLCRPDVRQQLARLDTDEALACSQAEPFHVAQQREVGFATSLERAESALLGAAHACIEEAIRTVADAHLVLPLSARDPFALLQVPHRSAPGLAVRIKEGLAAVPAGLGHRTEKMHALVVTGDVGAPVSKTLIRLFDAHDNTEPLAPAPTAPSAGADAFASPTSAAADGGGG